MRLVNKKPWLLTNKKQLYEVIKVTYELKLMNKMSMVTVSVSPATIPHHRIQSNTYLLLQIILKSSCFSHSIKVFLYLCRYWFTIVSYDICLLTLGL